MRALINRGGGGVEPAEVPEPEPAESEVVVGVRAMAVNRGELRLMAARPRGWRPGQDVAGVVVQAAADGSGPGEGSRVVAWPEQAGWAERVALPSNKVALLADRVSFSSAATLPIAGMTALRALRLGGNLLGSRVLITGAAGGVGRFAVELAALQGAAVTAVAAGPARAEGLEELGAGSIVHEVGAADGPFQLILESAGGASLAAAVGQIAPRGMIVMFGNSSNTPTEIAFGDFRERAGARIEVFFVYESGEPPTFGEDLQLLADLVADGRLHPRVGFEASWRDADSAFEALAERRVKGKAVLLVD